MPLEQTGVVQLSSFTGGLIGIAATEDRIYRATKVRGSRQNTVFVSEYNGDSVSDATFNVATPGGITTGWAGFDVDNGICYGLTNGTFSRNPQITQYTISDGTTTHQSFSVSSSFRSSMAGLVKTATGYLILADTGSQEYFIPVADDLTVTTPSSEPATLFNFAYGLAATENYPPAAYFVNETFDDPYIIRAFASNLAHVAAEDVTPAEGIGPFTDITWANNSLMGYRFRQREVVFYSAPVDLSLGGDAIRQFHGHAPYVEQFDVIRVDKDDAIVGEPLAVNANCLRETSARFVDTSSQATISTQLATVEFIFQNTLPTIAVGDKIFAHETDGESPTALPDTHYNVVGIKSAGASRRQIIYTELVEP